MAKSLNTSLYYEQNRDDVKSLDDVLAYITLNNYRNLPSLLPKLKTFQNHGTVTKVDSSIISQFDIDDDRRHFRYSAWKKLRASIPRSIFFPLTVVHVLLMIPEVLFTLTAAKILMKYKSSTFFSAKAFFGLLNIAVAQPLFALANIISYTRLVVDSLINLPVSFEYSLKKLGKGLLNLIPAAAGAALYFLAPPLGIFANTIAPSVSVAASSTAYLATPTIGFRWLKQARDLFYDCWCYDDPTSYDDDFLYDGIDEDYETYGGPNWFSGSTGRATKRLGFQGDDYDDKENKNLIDSARHNARTPLIGSAFEDENPYSYNPDKNYRSPKN